MKAEVEKIFNDLDAYKDFCRFNGKVFDEAALYRKSDRNWQTYERYLRDPKGWNRPRKPMKKRT